MFEREDKTDEHMKAPEVGDRFCEMLTFWVYVVHVNNELGQIVTVEASAPCELPKDGKVKIQTLDEFQKRFAYGSIPGYWVRYIDGGNNVEGWF